MRTTRLGYLESVRGLAAAVVFVFHALLAFAPGIPGFEPRVLARWPQLSGFPLALTYNGQFAVCVFFVLSGYVLTRAFFVSGDIRQLARRALGRYVRLALPSLASILFVLVLQRLHLYAIDQYWQLRHLAPSQVGLPGASAAPVLRDALRSGLVFTWAYLPDPARIYNQVLWTMPIEFWGSLLVFGLAAVLTPLRRRTTLILVLGVGLALFGGLWSPYFAAFLFGMAIASAEDKLPRAQWPYWALLPLGLYLGCRNDGPDFVWCTRLSDWLNDMAFAPWWMNWIYTTNVTGAALVLLAVIGARPLRAVLTARAFVLLGRYSFPFYLVHQPVLLSFGARVAVWLSGGGWTVGCLLLTILASALASALAAVALEHAVDRPAVALGQWIGASLLDAPASAQAEPRRSFESRREPA